MSGILNNRQPTSIEEALALGYSLSQVDELRARLKESHPNHGTRRPQSSSRARPTSGTFPQHSIASSSEIDEDEDSTEILSQSNSMHLNEEEEEGGQEEFVQRGEEEQTEFERNIRQANHQAMLMLMEDDFESSRAYLDQALRTLDEISQGNGEALLKELKVPLNLFHSLQIQTWNNEASWWKGSGEPAKALEVLGQALNVVEEMDVPPTDRATTCSNLAAVLSQVSNISNSRVISLFLTFHPNN
jgi:uncharacterized protein (UPF0147 family)